MNVEKRLRNKFGVSTTSGVASTQFTNWLFFASYVNNFKYSAETTICDGLKNEFFKTDKVTATPPTKADTQLKLQSATVWTMKVPFYVLLTGDMGREKVLVTGIVDGTTMNITRGGYLGGSTLNFNVDRPASYPSVSDPDNWVCPPNRYNIKLNIFFINRYETRWNLLASLAGELSRPVI